MGGLDNAPGKKLLMHTIKRDSGFHSTAFPQHSKNGLA
jgi:hypothetical protein